MDIQNLLIYEQKGKLSEAVSSFPTSVINRLIRMIDSELNAVKKTGAQSGIPHFKQYEKIRNHLHKVYVGRTVK